VVTDGTDLGISIRGVDKSFTTDSGPLHALQAVDLDIAAGEFVSVIGPSGCGKSTLLRLVGGLLEPDAGTIVVGGTTPDAARRDQQYSLVPQTPALLPWRRVRDNITLLTDLADRGGPATDIDGLIDRLGLTPFLDAHPHTLSGGLQQRVSLARAFALDAPVLLMDEPFSSLDEITRADLRYLLLSLWRDTTSTVLFVTHSIAEAVALSDRVVVLGSRPGRVVDTVRIPLDRPRHDELEDTGEFHRLVVAVRSALAAGRTGA